MKLEHDAPGADTKQKPQRKVAGLRVIALIKIAKGLLLTGLGFGFFHAINHDFGETVRSMTVRLRIDPENSIVRLLLEKIANVDPRTLRTIGVITFVSAGELFVEGVGLWLNQAWAKYLLIVGTGAFLPFEARACIVNFSWERLILILLNLVALLYVVWLLWYQKHPKGE
jgi:uncharacterized membrane protein (DUF2068 family)